MNDVTKGTGQLDERLASYRKHDATEDFLLEQSDSPLTGKLLQLDGQSGTWVERYVVISGDNLAVFRGPAATECSTSLNLAGGAVRDASGAAFVITSTCPPKALHLSCSSLVEKEQWMRWLNAACDKLSALREILLARREERQLLTKCYMAATAKVTELSAQCRKLEEEMHAKKANEAMTTAKEEVQQLQQQLQMQQKEMEKIKASQRAWKAATLEKERQRRERLSEQHQLLVVQLQQERDTFKSVMEDLQQQLLDFHHQVSTAEGPHQMSSDAQLLIEVLKVDIAGLEKQLQASKAREKELRATITAMENSSDASGSPPHVSPLRRYQEVSGSSRAGSPGSRKPPYLLSPVHHPRTHVRFGGEPRRFEYDKPSECSPLISPKMLSDDLVHCYSELHFRHQSHEPSFCHAASEPSFQVEARLQDKNMLGNLDFNDASPGSDYHHPIVDASDSARPQIHVTSPKEPGKKEEEESAIPFSKSDSMTQIRYIDQLHSSGNDNSRMPSLARSEGLCSEFGSRPFEMEGGPAVKELQCSGSKLPFIPEPSDALSTASPPSDVGDQSSMPVDGSSTSSEEGDLMEDEKPEVTHFTPHPESRASDSSPEPDHISSSYQPVGAASASAGDAPPKLLRRSSAEIIQLRSSGYFRKGSGESEALNNTGLQHPGTTEPLDFAGIVSNEFDVLDTDADGFINVLQCAGVVANFDPPFTLADGLALLCHAECLALVELDKCTLDHLISVLRQRSPEWAAPDQEGMLSVEEASKFQGQLTVAACIQWLMADNPIGLVDCIKLLLDAEVATAPEVDFFKFLKLRELLQARGTERRTPSPPRIFVNESSLQQGLSREVSEIPPSECSMARMTEFMKYVGQLEWMLSIERERARLQQEQFDQSMAVLEQQLERSQQARTELVGAVQNLRMQLKDKELLAENGAARDKELLESLITLLHLAEGKETNSEEPLTDGLVDVVAKLSDALKALKNQLLDLQNQTLTLQSQVLGLQDQVWVLDSENDAILQSSAHLEEIHKNVLEELKSVKAERDQLLDSIQQRTSLQDHLPCSPSPDPVIQSFAVPEVPCPEVRAPEGGNTDVTFPNLPEQACQQSQNPESNSDDDEGEDEDNEGFRTPPPAQPTPEYSHPPLPQQIPVPSDAGSPEASCCQCSRQLRQLQVENEVQNAELFSCRQALVALKSAFQEMEAQCVRLSEEGCQMRSERDTLLARLPLILKESGFNINMVALMTPTRQITQPDRYHLPDLQRDGHHPCPTPNEEPKVIGQGVRDVGQASPKAQPESGRASQRMLHQMKELEKQLKEKEKELQGLRVYKATTASKNELAAIEHYEVLLKGLERKVMDLGQKLAEERSRSRRLQSALEQTQHNIQSSSPSPIRPCATTPLPLATLPIDKSPFSSAGNCRVSLFADQRHPSRAFDNAEVPSSSPT